MTKEPKTAYRFYNFETGNYGAIWAEHQSCGEREGKTPENCVKQKVGEDSDLPCNFCEEND